MRLSSFVSAFFALGLSLAACGGDASGDSGSAAPSPDGVNPRTSLPRKSAGCGKPATPSVAAGEAKKIDAGGKARSYLLYVPKGYDPNRAYPLVFVVHGLGATGPKMAQFVKMQDITAGDAIVVFPDGLGGKWDVKGDGDFAFFEAMVNGVGADLCVDPQRVFAEGFSFGAYMVNALGCKLPQVFRGIAAADGGFNVNGCTFDVAALVYHRTEDDNEPIKNGIAARDLWIAQNGCGQETKSINALGCVEYQGCRAGAPVVWCEDKETSKYKHDLRDVYRAPIWDWMKSLE